MRSLLHPQRSLCSHTCTRPSPCLLLRTVQPVAVRSSCCNRKIWIQMHALPASDASLPDNVDLNDPELQQQINDILKELDPDLLLDDTELLVGSAQTAPNQTHQAEQVTQQQQQPGFPDLSTSSAYQATAWQEEAGDEETESGLPEGVVLTRAEYKRKAAVLVELMAALQSEGAEEALQQKLSAFRVEVDEALLHMLGRRLEAAKTHGQNPEEVVQLQALLDLLQLEYERASASPALRLLDEVMDLLGDEMYLPGARQRAEQVVQRLRSAFTGGAAENVDIFAAAAALAADKALAAEALAVEYVPQALFLSECMELLQQAKDEMQTLATAVSDAQRELQQVRNTQPQLLEAPQAKQHMQQVAAADEVLQRRKAAVAQLAYVVDLAQDLDAAERKLEAAEAKAASAGDMPGAEDLAALLGIE